MNKRTFVNGFKETAIACTLSMGVVNGASAAFTGLPASTGFRMEINSGCFSFGNCQATGDGPLQDNGQTVAGIGSGIAGDGLMGVIEFITDTAGTSLSVTSFAQDAYLNTAGGTFVLRDAASGAGMSGTIDGSGNMTFRPTGRTGLAASFVVSLGEQPWNVDNSAVSPGGTGLYDVWTTGSSTNRIAGVSPVFTLTGTPLQDAGAGVWTGTLVVAGNIGTAWGFFDSTQYSELFNVTIRAMPDPVAVADTSSTSPGVGVVIDVLANDNDPQNDIDAATVVVVSAPASGGTSSAIPDSATGAITYTPDPSFVGTDTFTYQVSDTASNTSIPATVTVVVAAAGNNLPVAVDDVLVTDEDVAGTVDVLVNDSDLDIADVLSVVANTAPAHGSVINNGDGTLTYTPNANFNGSDSFGYTLADGSGGQATATVSVTVTAVNDDPVANTDTVVTQLDTPLDISVLNNDNDLADVGDVLSVQSFAQPANGVVTDNNDGTLKYTPNAGFAGTDQFTYVISDGNGGTDTGTVNITVISVAFSGPVAPDIPGAQISPDVSGGSNFTMINPDGSDIGGTNDLLAEWDGTVKTDANDPTANMRIATSAPTAFFGFVWEATTVRVFGPGTYTFDTCPGSLTNSGGVLGWVAPDGSTNCDPGGNNDLSMTVGPSQLGAHMLFNWNQSRAIDVAMVWDINSVWAGPPDGTNQFGAAGAVFTFAVSDSDGDGIPGQPMADGPFKGFNANFSINLNPMFALPPVNTSAAQGGAPTSVVVPNAGNVTVTANVGPGSFNFDWSGSDAALVAASTNGTSNSTFEFDPSALPDGVVEVHVVITDNAAGGLQNTDTVLLKVDSTQTLANAGDSDGDGVPNMDDPIADPTRVQGVSGNSNTYLLATSAGQIILGDMATAKGVQTGSYGATLSASDIGVSDSTVTDSCVGGCFDFEVVGVPVGGAVKVVLPLSEGIPADAIYRKFVDGQWRSFRLTGTSGGAVGGELASAPGGPGTCPAPNDPAYTAGLNEGDFCVQLTLNDGGRNDADGKADGRIRDPGGVGGAAAQVVVVSKVPDPDTGGCAINNKPVNPLQRADWWLLAAFIGWLGARFRRRQFN